MELQYKEHRILEYVLIIAIYYVTGGAFSYMFYGLQISLLFIITFMMMILMHRGELLLRRSAFTPWIMMSFFIFLVPMINEDSFSSYIANIMQISIGFFCATIIPIKQFKEKYINIMVFFAMVSLLAFGIGAVMPSIATRFPLIIGDASVDYYNAGVYVYMKPKGYAANYMGLMTRNSGICWEPGCYQCFLNIALLFLFEKKKERETHHFYLQMLILKITIITTLSTTGYIILAILLIAYYNVWKGKTKSSKLIIMIVAIILTVYFFWKSDFGSHFIQKITRELAIGGSEQNFLTRTSIGHIRYLFEGGFWFFGMSFSRWLTFMAPSLWNSIIHSALCMGIPFTSIHLIGYWKGSHSIAKKGELLFLIMIMCASTETLFWRCFFNTIAAYGWIYQGSVRSESCESANYGGTY